MIYHIIISLVNIIYYYLLYIISQFKKKLFLMFGYDIQSICNLIMILELRIF